MSHGVDQVTPPPSSERETVKTAQPSEWLLQFFAYDHLPEPLRKVSKPFGVLAAVMVENLPRNAERTTALRKLLEAKDCAVRALVAK